MMPLWSTAPDWARYVAMDPDGTWWWYEDLPWINRPFGCWDTDGRYRLAEESRWKESMEERP